MFSIIQKSAEKIPLTLKAVCTILVHVCASKIGVGEATLTCSGCNNQFVVPAIRNAYRCYKCHCVSNSNGSFKLNNANSYTNTTLSPFASSSLSLSTPGNKRAVICGVSYGKRKFKLEGTVNDVVNMKSLLLDKFKFPTHCIRVLTEDEKDPSLIPTKRNILESLNWLVRDCESEDSLVFYFSGHGLQQPEDCKGDEIDGLDETICPVDFMREGMITDNEINSIIVKPLKKGVTLHAIVDACHSGTSLDLSYLCKKEKGSWVWKENRPPHTKEPMTQQTRGGLAICFSACEDCQMAADTAAFEGNKFNGIMTYLFSKIIKDIPEITYASLIEKIHEEIGKVHQSKFYNSILKRIFHRKIDQDPLLSSSEKFDIATRIFKL
ncbi:hypothetical protein VNO78_03602 [Psophocarpus tetragonolobus]|uniref:Peptidase C14 caspase domain-containing protein n=1 Tax=Psophocarpus tetragonolobus TaxID=3891 RepID=A0AAN9T4G9_PSOTE